MTRFLDLIRKGIKNPSAGFKWIYINLRPSFIKLKPTTIKRRDADIFFEIAASKNKKNILAVNPIIKKSKCIFDIGSNCGYISKEIIDQGYEGDLVLFEPISNLLSISIQILSHTNNNKIFVNAALGDKDTKLTLILPEDNNIGWITAVKEKTVSKSEIKVNQEKTSKYIRKFYPDFCKIDVEGYEYFILKEFNKLISNEYKPSFLVEIGFGNTNPYWKEFLDLVKDLFSKGYYFFDIKKDIVSLNFNDIELLEDTTDIIITTYKLII